MRAGRRRLDLVIYPQTKWDVFDQSPPTQLMKPQVDQNRPVIINYEPETRLTEHFKICNISNTFYKRPSIWKKSTRTLENLSQENKFKTCL